MNRKTSSASLFIDSKRTRSYLSLRRRSSGRPRLEAGEKAERRE
jgi:hypothetical protein